MSLGDDEGEEVRKIYIGEKVDRGDDFGPAIEIKLELPPAARDSALASFDLDEEEEEEGEVIRIESIEVTTLEPSEVEALKVSGRGLAQQNKFNIWT